MSDDEAVYRCCKHCDRENGFPCPWFNAHPSPCGLGCPGSHPAGPTKEGKQ